ncbi:acyl-CoA thioesterase [Nibribacter ruber]|uniref:Acyl-CoA thioesterase n=1 Tax=Nibribacter ruber TaxID=2698458 RepID=A0A6P1NV11_9BACT|nr:thioesterase family protein [Nibribacter ruber]QHL86109.1 acyl-CoA thioesterase [Nibribacter ruber]
MSTEPSDKFSLAIQVQPADIDALGHVNNVVYVRWVQEVSAAHWEHVAPQEIKDQYLWVILRHEIDFLKPAMPNDTVTGYTWVGDYHGAKFERYVSLYRTGTQELLASAKTIWCLVDAKTMRPRRIEQALVELL